MDIFSFQKHVVDAYAEFSKSFCKIKSADLEDYVRKAQENGKYWPEPLIQVNPNFKVSDTVDAFAEKGQIHPKSADVFRPNGSPLSFFEHQATALAFARAEESYVVTTGTGSGKSLTYFIPIIDAILAAKDQPGHKSRTMALIVYPMNALANSQIEELSKFLGDPAKGSTKHGITFGRYTGQESDDERRRLAENPPDILLTNYMMLELLLTRHGEHDAKVIANAEGLRFFVLDEMHVYRGRQGADMAMLCRRTLQRLDPDQKAVCVGTSATMSSDGGTEEKNKVVASVASKLFGRSIDHHHVITETLDPVTYSSDRSEKLDKLKLSEEVRSFKFDDLDYRQLKATEIARWVEDSLGIDKERLPDGTEASGWIRRTPISMARAIELLADATSIEDKKLVAEKLKSFLLAASQKTSNGRPLFAFKLHQFVSAPGKLLAPLLPAGDERKSLLRMDGQIFAKSIHGSLPLFSTHFCRECGQDYHPVEGLDGIISSREIDDRPSNDETKGDEDPYLGFLSMGNPEAPWDSEAILEKAPDDWKESGKDRFRKDREKALAQIIHVNPFGQVNGPGSNPALFVPGKFRYCPSCGASFGDYSKDRLNLTPLSGEGRSSATTAISLATLSWLHKNIDTSKPGERNRERRKLLGFSDNRQDAALQAGHFNDFKRILLTRGALIRALSEQTKNGVLRAGDAGSAIFEALGFSKPENYGEYLKDPNKEGNALLADQQVLKNMLSHRAIADLQDTGRYNNPSLERLGLVKVDYEGLLDFCEDDAKWSEFSFRIKDNTVEQRLALCETVLDKMRAQRCIAHPHLQTASIANLIAESFILTEDWGFSEQERYNPVSMAHTGMILPDIKASGEDKKKTKDPKKGKAKDNGIKSSGPSSALGRAAKAKGLPKGPNYAESIRELFQALGSAGFLNRETSQTQEKPLEIYRVDARKISWRLLTAPNGNYFARLYREAAASLANSQNWMFSLEAREHTAQVDQDERQTREERFRFTEDDKAKLKNKGTEKRLPLLFCSPTMELGVDISSLDAVYMRNTPPTPANYAQRAGRAGRAGQAALAITYCASQSPHDQYFFASPQAMVSGAVKAPNIDLANPDLVRSHLHALWLTHMGVHLESAIGDFVEKPTGKDFSHAYPILSDLSAALRPIDDSGALKPTFLAAKTKALDLIQHMRSADKNFPAKLDDPWVVDVMDNAHKSFDASLNRWRELCRAADRQIIECQAIIDNRQADPEQIKEAKGRRKVAETQIETLLKGKSSFSDDFYSYRELASQGFLPGYSFPRLPLMAYLPPKDDGDKKRTFLSRPRFLALGEFGPFSLIYHEGRRYRVDRAILSLSGDDKISSSSKLPIRDANICQTCGYGHFEAQKGMELCLNCGAPLDDKSKVERLFRIDNVSTRPIERINANEEERSKQGYDIKTTFQFGVLQGGKINKTSIAYPLSSAGNLRVSYGPSATIWRINHGFKRGQKNQKGFYINPISGRWLSSPTPDGNNSSAPDSSESEIAAANIEARSEKTKAENIIPYVEDRRNALLIYPPKFEDIQTSGTPSDDDKKNYLPTLQHALKRGIEAEFDLEESEMMAEPLPDRDDRQSILIYESAEGGAGVLTRLATDPDALSKVAKAALEVMHYAASEAVGAQPSNPSADCEKACYRCLLSYSNQPDHRRIDRANPYAMAVLRTLAQSKGIPDASEQTLPAVAPGASDDAQSAHLERWALEARKLSLDPKRFALGDLPCAATPDFFLRSKSGKILAAYVGREPGVPDQEAIDDADGSIFRFPAHDDWSDSFTRLKKKAEK